MLDALMTDPVYAPWPTLACVVPDCPDPVTATMVVVLHFEEHQLPVCAGHHLEFSQPGHLRHLKALAGLDRAQPPAPEPMPVEPGPEVVKPRRKR